MSGRERTGGFTLVEMMIVVIIIGLLAAIAVPAMLSARTRSQASVLAGSLRTYSHTFEIYATENAGWPPDAIHGEVPAGMEGQLPGFTEPTIVGGNFDWEYNTMGVTAGLSIMGSHMSPATAQQIDRILDDGNLGGGRFMPPWPMPEDSEPEKRELLVANDFVRGRNVLVASGDFTGLFEAYRNHLARFKLETDPEVRECFRDFLAGFTLHAASHPRNEVMAWTLHFQDPPLNLFLTADTELSTVAGRSFTEGLKEEESNMFYQDLVVRGKPLHRSIVPFAGKTAKGTIEFFYNQSEQRPGRFFRLGDNRFCLVTAHPDYDEAWFRSLDRENILQLGQTEILSRIENRSYTWHCGCHYKKILQILAHPMQQDPEALFGAEEAVTVNCPRCAARYRVSREAMEAFLAEN